jgi:hypothetical protein
VFCPGLVPTNLSDNSQQMRGDGDPYYQSKEHKKIWQAGKQSLDEGLPLEQAIDGFFAGLEADDFYIRTHANEEDQVLYRTQMVLNRTRPKPIPQR